MKNSILLILTLLTYRPVTSQPRLGLEQYFCSGSSAAAAPVTRVYFETATKNYVEARYNYDAEGCFGISAGRRFESNRAGNKALAWTLTPTVGLVTGNCQGFSLGANFGVRFHAWNFSSAVQFTPAKTEGYGYSWSEAGRSFGDKIYLGVALQQDWRFTSACRWSPGLTAQLSLGSWTLPVYIFNPFEKGVWLLAGLTREWVLHKKPDHPKKSLPSQ